MQRRLGLVEFSHLDWLYTKCTYSTLVVHGWVHVLHSICVSKWPGLPLSHSFGICPSFSGSWPHPGLWYSSCIWYRYSSNTWNNFSAGTRMQWNALHFLVEQTLVHLIFIWQNVHAWFWLYTQNWIPSKVHMYQHNMAVQSSAESRCRNSFSYGTYCNNNYIVVYYIRKWLWVCYAISMDGGTHKNVYTTYISATIYNILHASTVQSYFNAMSMYCFCNHSLHKLGNIILPGCRRLFNGNHIVMVPGLHPAQEMWWEAAYSNLMVDVQR